MKTLFPPRKIIAAVDDTAPSWAAFAAAKLLAARLGAALEALYVEPLLPVSTFEPGLAQAQRAQHAQRESIRERVAAEAHALPPGGLTVHTTLGIPTVELLKRAAPRTAQLLAMGTHGREGAERFLLGSVAEAVLHRARIPVLAVHEGAFEAPRRLLVACNLEPYADQALRYALALARALGAEVSALYVSDESDADLRLLRHLEDALGVPDSREVQRLIRRGDPREQIAREAGSGRHDLLVLSGHHRARLSDLALGTTAERTLRRCRLPLLVIPAKSEGPVRFAKPSTVMAWK